MLQAAADNSLKTWRQNEPILNEAVHKTRDLLE